MPQETIGEALSRILVVDDDVFILEMLCQVLKQYGFAVYGVSSGKAALDLLQNVGGKVGGVDLVITDVNMPGMDGETLARQVKTSYPGIPVIGMSGSIEQPYADAVFDHFLSKPISLPTIFQAVRRMLAEHAIRFAPPAGSERQAI